MNWTTLVENRLKLAASLLLIIGLVLAANLYERAKFRELKGTLHSMYDDRLIAESYLFEITVILREKETLIGSLREAPDNSALLAELVEKNAALEQIIDQYRATYLTPDEEVLFASLSTSIHAAIDAESDLYTYSTSQQAGLTQQIYHDLSGLSDLQKQVGKTLTDRSSKIVSGSMLTSNLEIVMLLVIGLIVQVITLRSHRPTVVGNIHLN